MKKTNKTQFVLFVLILLVSISSVYSLSITNLNVSQVSNRYAIIQWTTDIPSTTNILFGVNASNLVGSKSSSVLTTNHSIMISPLANNTRYYFNVSSANGSDVAVQGNNSLLTTQLDTSIPFIDIELPDYVGSTSLNILGLTEPTTQVYVYVNETLSSSGFMLTGVDGVINLPGILFRSGSGKVTPNLVRIVALDPYGNRNELVKVVNVDTTPPGITIDGPAKMKAVSTTTRHFAWGERAITIKGNSDEPAKMDATLKDPAGNVLFTTTINISSPWQFTTEFPADGTYYLSLYATDRTGVNPFAQEYEIVVDTQPLYLVSTNINDLSPSYVIHRTLKGKVNKANATIIVYVNNKTTSDALDLMKVAKSLGDIGFPDLSGGNNQNQFISTITSGDKLSYLTYSDENGEFKVNIELESLYKITQEEAQSLRFSTDDGWANDITIFVSDEVGRNASISKAVYYTRCGAGGLFTVSSPTTSPNIIPEPILKQGFGQFSLTMTLKWNGPSDRSEVEFQSPPKMIKQALSQEDMYGKYNATMGSGAIYKSNTVYPNQPLGPEDNQLYALVLLNAPRGDIKTKLEQGKLLDADLEFPLMLELEYRYPKSNGEMSETIIQRSCINTKIQIDPESDVEILKNNELLNKTIGTFDKIINFTDSLLPKLKTIQNGAMILCGAGLITQFVTNAWVKISCASDGVPYGDIKNALVSGECNVYYDSTGKLSGDCSGPNAEKYNRCMQNTITALNVQEVSINTICDRIFCPSVPSLAKHIKTYDDLVVKRPGVTNTQSPSSGEVVAKVKNAATKCAVNIYSSAGEGSDCEGEFNRAWGKVTFWTWPYKNIYDLAQKKASGSQKQELPDGIVEGLVKVVSGLDKNICTSQNPNNVTYKTTGVKDVDGTEYAFEIYTERNVDGTESVVVNYGKYRAVGTFQTDKTGKKTELVTDPMFDPIARLNIDAEGYCTKSDQNDPCVQAVTRIKNAPEGKRYRLPPEVISAMNLQPTEDYVYSPTSGLVPAVASLCIPAIKGYVTSYNALLKQINACFKEIYYKGTGNAGTCNALVSQVVCDLVVSGISCANQFTVKWAISNGAKGVNAENSLNPFASITLAADSISNTIGNRYGETTGYKALFNENKLVHSVCMGAFTGDWNLEFLGDVLTEATDIPVDSTCVPYPASRRFMTANPLQSGKTTYIYHTAGMLAAGADITSLSVQLVCSNDNTCTKYEATSNPGGQCDCSGMPTEKITNVPITKTSLSKGDVFDEENYITIRDQEYRYDKMRITYSYKDSTGKEITRQCQSDLREELIAPSNCKFTVGLGFRCEFNVGDRGTASFVEVPKAIYIPGTSQQKVFSPTPGDNLLELYTKVEVKSPKDNEIRKYLGILVKNQYGQAVYSNIFPLQEGMNEAVYPGDKDTYRISQADFKKTSASSGGAPLVEAATGVSAKISSTSANQAHFAIKFKNNGAITECYDYFINSKNEREIKTTSIGSGTGSSITCNGVLVQITKAIDAEINENSVIYVDYAGAAQEGSCINEDQTWTAVFTLYHSQNGDQISPARVYANGAYQEKSITFKANCNPSGTSTVSSSTIGAVVLASTVPSQIKIGAESYLYFRIADSSKDIDGVQLKIGNKEAKSIINMNSIKKEMILNEKIDSKFTSNLKKDDIIKVSLSVNGKQFDYDVKVID